MARRPLKHQTEELLKSANEPIWALWWEQRVAKTGVVIRTAAQNYRSERIDAAVVISFPSGVRRVWDDEWKLDWPEELQYKLFVWSSQKANTQSVKYELEQLLKFKGFSVLSLNCEAIITKTAWNYLQRFLKHRKVLVCADESSWAASPGSARTKRLLAIGRHSNVVMKRILDGTPADESPLDLWAPCAFLDPKLLGYNSFFTFRARYAKLEEGYAAGGRTFKKVVGYQNLDELQRKLSKFSSRLRRSDISDAPPKTYETIYFEMTPSQKEVYTRLQKEYLAELNGEQLQVAHVLKRMIRLQMIARNFFPPEEHGVVCPACQGIEPEVEECQRCEGFGIVVETTKLHRIDPDRNPALEALMQRTRMESGPICVWAKYRQDTLDVHAAILKQGRHAVRYDGGIPEDEREAAYQGFRQGKYDAIVATIDSGLQRGKDLTRADALIYYSNSYSLRARRQSEDRAEGLQRNRSTAIIDLVAEDTNDHQIIQALREKRSIAELLMGDKPENWI